MHGGPPQLAGIVMTFEDRIRESIDGALADVKGRLEGSLRRVVDESIGAAVNERERVLAVQHETALQAAAEDARHRLDQASSEARLRERQIEIAAVSRLLDSIRALDAASTLSEVLDALAIAAAGEASRAAVLVVRQARLVGWRLSGFGDLDMQPRTLDLGLNDSGAVGLAVSTSRATTTREGNAGAPAFAALRADHMGLAVPVNVGGRAVAVVYADSGAVDNDGPHQTPSSWPEVVEVLARHAARCLEALTVQKTATASAPRFLVQSAGRPGMAT